MIGIARPLYVGDTLGVDLDASLYVLDSTTIDLCLALFPWARFRTRKAAVKMHTLLDLHGNIPAFIHIPDGKMHDVQALDRIDIEPGAYYVMDRGYIDFERLYRFTLGSAFFVTRTKKNILLERRYSHPVDKSTGVSADQTVILTSLESASAYPDKLRRISYRDPETGKRLKFLTDNFTLHRSPSHRFTNSAGRSNCSSNGSNSIFVSRPSSAPARTPSRPRSGSPSPSMSSSPSSENG